MPFKDYNRLRPNVTQKRFNYLLSCLRFIIEQMFGKLKMRFPQLRWLNMEVLFAPKVAAACCVLHNFLLDRAAPNELELVRRDDSELALPELADGSGGVTLEDLAVPVNVDLANADPRSRAAGLRQLKEMMDKARVHEVLRFIRARDPETRREYARPPR